MNRRGFFKSLFAAGVAAKVVSVVNDGEAPPSLKFPSAITGLTDHGHTLHVHTTTGTWVVYHAESSPQKWPLCNPTVIKSRHF
jgi:hypothetical protein